MPRRVEKKFFNLNRFTVFLIVAALFSFWAFFKIHQLGNTIEEKFTRTKRWNIPSRVYADTEYLYPGVNIARRGLVTKLERLGYREVAHVKGPGEFNLSATALEIHLHDFAYPQEKFSGFPVRLELKEKSIERIVDLESNEALPLVRLEPEEIATLFDVKMEDRTLVTLKECPHTLLEAIIAIEDERFFKHHGIDPVAIARAAAADLIALKVVQGGSTLTQQLVKNFFLTSKKSFGRKINEAVMALLLEKKHTKAEILEAYLNEIYLGQRGASSVTGVSEAAKQYFGKDIHQITLAESALLAGMIRNPGAYSPFTHKPKAVERRNTVLKKMLENGVITEAEMQSASKEEIITPKSKSRTFIAPYFIDFLKQQLADLYPEEVLETEGLKIFTTLDMNLQGPAKNALTAGLANLDKEGKLQGCILVVSPQNGYVRAMVGGRDYQESQFNRCTQAMRQPGSTFKPFVYLTALDPLRSNKPFTLASMLDDKSFTIDTPEGPWSPENYEKDEHGMVTLRTALENSYNIATAKLGMEVGLDHVVQTARDAGITSTLNPYPSLALGAFEVTPLEMAEAYTIFPNLGLKAQPLSIINVMTTDGQVLEKKNVKIKRVFEQGPVALVDTLLQGVIERGTARSALSYGLGGRTAGKTGTTSNYKDAWFVGFTPELLSLVWVGFDDNSDTKMSGARAALPIWASFMKEVVGPESKKFTFPEEIIQVEVDPTCSSPISEYFIKGTEPKSSCEHKNEGKALPPDEF